jgi:hypothetical protein
MSHPWTRSKQAIKYSAANSRPPLQFGKLYESHPFELRVRNDYAIAMLMQASLPMIATDRARRGAPLLMGQIMCIRRVMAVPVIGSVVCILLSSCAQPLGKGPVDWEHGARRGRVLELLTPDAAWSVVQACAPQADGADAPQRFAKVRYRGTRLHHTVVAALPGNVEAHVGDEVELWPANCSEKRMARVERVLAEPAAR